MFGFGGGDRNPMLLPDFHEGNHQFQYDTISLHRLQLSGNVQVGCNISPINHMANNHSTKVDPPSSRSMDTESILRQQKHLISLNNNIRQDTAGRSGSVLNPNPVSTGLRLSREEDEYNSSVTSSSESMRAVLPVITSLGDNLKVEIDRQKEEVDRYIKIQEEKIAKGVMELNQRHMVHFLSSVEKGVVKKLHEKEIEMDNINRKNKELTERIKHVSAEVQSWHSRAKYNESVVNFLNNSLQQVMARGSVYGKEGYGDSEEDDTASFTNSKRLKFVDGSGDSVLTKKQINCRVCNVKEVSVILLPCRHLCLCKDCEVSIHQCPLCRITKTTSIQVFMS
ncbi:probable BOI-related E3 ubiquitin-protein ligase 2 isoform X1 [Ziziphus jujuba]|uniref:Probable BOI-related E3 ubiquitin-protein ligase 2 isoform X1 n=2 Tax=Ziziphus jujuba TaxID=326968 RepID=A0A6P4A9Y9_ZIZJJ|nr:probable BOI-related E3 ubiquitin-protein ligase 2 isoform X1 [Ziziphus jujuba]